MESAKKEVKKVFVVTSEWSYDDERYFDLNGVFLNRADAIEKFKSIIETERKNCSFISKVYEFPDRFTYSEEYCEAKGFWGFVYNEYESWFEVHIKEQDLV